MATDTPLQVDVGCPRETGVWIDSVDATSDIDRRMSKEGPGAYPPLCVMDAFRKRVAEHGDEEVFYRQEGETWVATKCDYQCAKAMLHVGLEPHHGVCVLGFNSAEWFITHVAAIHAQGIATGIYSTNASDSCLFILNDCKAQVVFVDTQEQLDKILAVRSEAKDLKAIVMWRDTPKEKSDGVYTFDEFMQLGKDDKYNDLLEKRISAQKPGDVCCLIYTSGTTSMPKGALVTHDYITWQSRVVSETVSACEKDRLVSFLPLSHVAGMMIDIYGPHHGGFRQYFAQPDAFRGSLAKTISLCKPTILMAVPRVYEKMEDKMRDKQHETTGLKKMIMDWAQQKATTQNWKYMDGETNAKSGIVWNFYDKTVYSKVREALGFQEIRAVYSSAAPLNPATTDYFLSMNIPVMQCYGMSECVVIAIDVAGKHRVKTCGKELMGLTVKIQNPDSSGEGEVYVRGRGVFAGYLGKPEENEKMFTADGFMRTGDLGMFDERGYLKITGRAKDLMKTSGGEYIAPTFIEQSVKALLPACSQVVVIGDGRKYVVTLLALDTTLNESGVPTDNLSPHAIAELSRAGSSATTVAQAIVDPIVKQYVQTGVDTYNENVAINNTHRIRKFALLPANFSIATGEMTPTMKLKKRVVLDKYHTIIDALYVDS